MRKLGAILMAAMLLAAPFIRRAEAQSDEPPKYSVSPAEAKVLTEARARQIMIALKNRDMRRLSGFVHPSRGVRFSPYVYVDTKVTRVLSRRQLVSLYRSNRRLVWGEADGSGDPIRMTFRRYLGAYVYRQDLLSDKEPTYNPERTHSGNTISNLRQVYPRSIIVAYGHEGTTGPQGGAMDWQVLYLIFEKMGREWYLVGIANDEWTI
jgi:hypothetical protein